MASGNPGRFGEGMMAHAISPLWRSLPPDLAPGMDRWVAAALDKGESQAPVYVFFRADDVAVPGPNFARLMDLFTRCQVPLCLAVVPAWLTRARWQRLSRMGQKAPSLWCWHQHGWRHVNHEPEGRKQEFGPSRPALRVRDDLVRGERRLQALMGGAFAPFFTPPWNRCDQQTLRLLQELKYKAVSRSLGGVPPAPEGLPDFGVSVDLHTRRESDPLSGWECLFAEIGSALTREICGIMIHHQRMNGAAFVFLEILIQALRKQRRVRLVHFTDLHPAYERRAPFAQA
jgi:peptidoglycan/xylan/chitin deacetylase (PgdA/CDA1 family)